MHYSSTAFAVRGKTITTNDRSKQHIIDTNNRISGTKISAQAAEATLPPSPLARVRTTTGTARTGHKEGGARSRAGFARDDCVKIGYSRMRVSGDYQLHVKS